MAPLLKGGRETSRPWEVPSAWGTGHPSVEAPHFPWGKRKIGKIIKIGKLKEMQATNPGVPS